MNSWHCTHCHQNVYGVHQCIVIGGQTANCSYCYRALPIYQPTPSTVTRIMGNKCDICGSTAIDHTEMQCQFNRQILNNKGVSKSKAGKSTKHDRKSR